MASVREGDRAEIFADRATIALSCLVALAMFLPRLCRTLSLMGDSAVFVSAAATFGVPQPSGYPLFTALGFFASKLPIGEIPFRLHLTSALFHAATVGVVAAIVLRLGATRAAALGAALALAFSRAFFLGSLYAEVFPLNDLFTALAILAAIDVQQAKENELENRLVRFFLVAGLASAHHQMIALSAPGLALLLWRRLRGQPPRSRAIGRCALAFLGPIVCFSILLFLAGRRDSLAGNWGDVRSLGSLAWLMTRMDYGGPLSPHLGKKEIDGSTLVEVWMDGATTAFGWPLILVAILGAVSLYRTPSDSAHAEAGRERRAQAIAVGGVLLVSGPIFAVSNALEVDTEHGRAFAERFATMSAIPIAIFIGAGLSAIARATASTLPPAAVRVALGLSFLLPLIEHRAACDLRDDRRGIALAHDLFREVPDGSLLLVSGDVLNGAVHYVCGVEKRCGKTVAFSPGQMHLDWRVEQLRRRHPDLGIPSPVGKFVTVRELVGANLDRRSVWLSTQLLDLEPPLREAFQFIPDGLLVRALRDDAALLAEKATFVERARRFARADGCEGCGIARSQLVAPSLETAIPFIYALAFENHGRILGAWFPEERPLSALFLKRAERTDGDAIKKLR